MSAVTTFAGREKFFRKVPLPPDLTNAQIGEAMLRTEKVFRDINAKLKAEGVDPLSFLVQANNLGGIISNIYTAMLDKASPYKVVSGQKHPDLRHPGRKIDLEIKTANRPGKGGESHNGHGGWHIIACYATDEQTGDITFIHMMVANLIAYGQPETDWKFLASTRVGDMTGHIETYATNTKGRAKLLDGTVFINTDLVTNWKKWRRDKAHALPAHSIFYAPPPKKAG